MRILVFIFVFISSFSFGQSKEYKAMLSEYYNDFPTMKISPALEHLKAEDAIFIDVREKEEFNVSHIRTAIRVSPDGSDLKDLTIDKDKMIIVYCSVGARSQTIGESLKAKGYTNVFNLYGGLFHWANRKFPMVDSKGNKTTQIHGFSKEWGKWITNGKVVY